MDIHDPPPPHQRHYNLSDDDGLFGDFPPDDSIKPQTTNILRVANPQSTTGSSRIRFADDTRLSHSNRSSNNQVLVLGGSSNSNLSPNRPSSTHKTSEGSNSLDFSMITTPGGGPTGKQRENNGSSSMYTPSDFNTTNNTAASASSGRFSSILRGVVSSTPNINPRQLLSSSNNSSSTKTPYTAARESYMTEQSNNDNNDNNECTALQFARTAPLSGYLRKLGTNIPTFKRRFFVLKPSTHLYYFVSPNDIEPRGCIDLDMIYENDTNGNEEEGGRGGGCEVREIGVLADGTFRFELIFDEEVDVNEEDNASTDTSSRTSENSSRRRRRNFQRSSFVLEARTEELGREWMSKLQSERLSIAKNEVECLTSNLNEMKSISSRWETSACEEAMRADAAERQRNTAISEAQRWETKFNNLNEAIRLLVRNDMGNGSTSSEFLSEAIAALDVNDTNFGDVSEAFQTLNSKCNLASKRDTEANARIVELEQELKNAESRATKAETELVKVWEDNGTLQDDLKKTRREKRILVKEVKSLQAAAEENASKQQCIKQQHENDASKESHIDNERHDLRSTNSQSNSRGGASDTGSSHHTQPRRRRMNDEEKRLVIELEEHVMSGLRLSEQFLTLNGVDPSEVGDYDLDNSSAQASTQASTQTSKDRSPERQSRYHNSLQKQGSLSNLTPHTLATRVSDNEAKPLGSLLDDNDDDESEVALAESTTPHTSNKEIVHNHSDIAESTQGSSILNDIFLYEESPSGDNHNIHVNQNLNDRFIDTTRQQRESNHCYNEDQPMIHSRENSTVASSSVSESSRSKITDNGHATTKLECPLRDVGETSPHRTLGDDGKVYHITFYSKKIGLQFQKVPNETKPGLLTDAMTADHGPNIETNQTAAELRRIASISQNSHNRKHRSDDLSLECLPITPVDAVLVCGFIGFDDSNGNVRPRIGGK